METDKVYNFEYISPLARRVVTALFSSSRMCVYRFVVLKNITFQMPNLSSVISHVFPYHKNS